MGGEEQHGNQDHATDSSTRPAEEAHNTSGPEGNASASHPPGAFPRSVSPTLEEHPDNPIPDDANSDVRPSARPASTSASQTPAEPVRRETTNNANPQPPDTAADTSAARFISSLFHQRSASPLGNNSPRSPGPMGTASHLGRTSSSPTFIRSPSNPPFVPTRDFPASSAAPIGDADDASGPQRDTDHSTSSADAQPPAASPAEQATVSRAGPTDSTNENDGQRQPPHSPHPIYPTVIPAEHLERHARREALMRQSERQQEGSSDESGAGHTLSEYVEPISMLGCMYLRLIRLYVPGR